MALDVWFASDVQHGIASGLALLLETATANGQPNADFVRGALTMARAQAMQYGISWPAVVGEVRAATQRGGELGPLLAAAIE